MDVTTEDDVHVVAGAPPLRTAILAVVAVAVLVADQVTKALAEAHLEPGVRVPVLGDLLGLTLIYNPGAAFSFGTGMTWVFTIVMAAVSTAVLVAALRVRNRWWALALGSLLGGALGNLVDRLARDPGFGVGHVVDFIDYGIFIGNVADVAIVLAAVGLGALSMWGGPWDGAPRAEQLEADADHEAVPGTHLVAAPHADPDAPVAGER